MCIGGVHPKDTINLLIRTMTFFSSKKPIQKQVSLRQTKGVTVDPKLIENIEINDGSMLQEAVVGKSLITQGVSALEITPTNHSNHIRERAAGATGADENPDVSTMTREEKKEYVQNLVNEIFDEVDSPLLDPDEPAIDPEALSKFTGNSDEEHGNAGNQNDPAEEGGGDGGKPIDEEIDGGNGGGNADSEDSGGGFWDWFLGIFSDDEEDGNDTDGNDAGTGVDQSSDNPMNDHQGGGEPDGDSAPQDIDADINHGPDGKNDSSGESDFDTFDGLDPITNWGPNGKPSGAGAGIDIGIGLDDPNTNWDGGKHGDQHIDSPLIDVLGDVNPEFNASEDISANFVQLMAPSGNDFF